MMDPENQAFNLFAFCNQIEEILKWKQKDADRIRHFQILKTAYVATLPADVLRAFHEWERKVKGIRHDVEDQG